MDKWCVVFAWELLMGDRYSYLPLFAAVNLLIRAGWKRVLLM